MACIVDNLNAIVDACISCFRPCFCRVVLSFSHKAQKNLSLTPKFGKSEKINHVSQIKGDVAYRLLRIPIVGEELQGEQSKIRDSPFLSSPALFSSESSNHQCRPAGSRQHFSHKKCTRDDVAVVVCCGALFVSYSIYEK